MKDFVFSIELQSAQSGRLQPLYDRIEAACERAVKATTARIKDFNFGQPVTVTFIDQADRTIPEDGIAGSTINSGTIYIYVNPDQLSENAVYTTVCHELVHAKRFAELTDIDNRPIAAFVSEGLAVAFEEEIKDTDAPSTFFLRTMHDNLDVKPLVDRLAPEFNNKRYDWDANYGTLFFDGDPKAGIPRWAGYEIGYYLVRQLMQKSGKTASELVAEPADSFLP